MNAKFREFVKTGRGKLTVALGCLALSWIFLLWQFSGSIGDLMPAAERIGAVEREVRELRQQPVRGQNASSAGTVVQNLNFNGAIRVIGFDGDAAENGGGGK